VGMAILAMGIALSMQIFLILASLITLMFAVLPLTSWLEKERYFL